MSEENSNPESATTKGQGAVTDSASSLAAQKAESTEFSLEELDAEILKADPLFDLKFEDIKAVKIEGEIQIDSYDAESEMNAYFQEARESRGFRKWLFRILPFLPRLIRKINVWSFRAKAAIVHLFTALLPQFLGWIKNLLVAGLKQVGGLAHAFKKKSAGQKIGFFVFLLFTVAASYFTWFLWVKKPLDHPSELFVTTLEEFADQSYRYDPKTELEPFYNNYRVSQNIITIPRMVMNVKASENSGPNPMAAIELYIEGGSPEVVVEIKDREAEMKDVMQRAVEEMNFDELIVPEGKQALSDRLRREINRVLTKGKVRRIFLKSAVFKP